MLEGRKLNLGIWMLKPQVKSTLIFFLFVYLILFFSLWMDIYNLIGLFIPTILVLVILSVGQCCMQSLPQEPAFPVREVPIFIEGI